MACSVLSNQQRRDGNRHQHELQQREKSGHQGESLQPEKRCRVCEETKPLSSFTQNMSNNDGFRNDCRECRNKAKMARYAARKERLGGQPPVAPPAEERICSSCKKTKPWSDFAKEARSVFGIRAECKEGVRDRDRYRRVQASSASAS